MVSVVSRSRGGGFFWERRADNASRHFPSIRRRSSSWNKYVNRNFSFLDRPRLAGGPATILTSSPPVSSFPPPPAPLLAGEKRRTPPLRSVSTCDIGPLLSPLNYSTRTLVPICKRGSERRGIDTCVLVSQVSNPRQRFFSKAWRSISSVRSNEEEKGKKDTSLS